MAKSDELLDRIFREKLENQEVSPSPKAWIKLEAQLDEAKQPKRNTWWAIAASLPLLLGLGYLIWSQVPQTKQESPIAAMEEVSTNVSDLESIPEAEPMISEVNQKPGSQAETSPPRKSKPALKSGLPQENSQKGNEERMFAEAILSPSPQVAVPVELNLDTEPKVFLNPEPILITTAPNNPQTTLAVEEDQEGYRIRIFSNGLKKEEAPNKNLITELGKTIGQVEGLIEKLDEGFVEIQDKKERFLSLLVSRKTTSMEKQ